MKKSALIYRNIKELIRDPLSLIFGIGLPVFLLFMMTFVQKGTGVEIFEIDKLAPGIMILSMSFISLFSGMLIAGDRESAFLTRLFASPLKPGDYIITYTIPLLIVSIIQAAVCIFVSLFLGLTFTLKSLMIIVAVFPVALSFVGIGLLLGSFLKERQVGGVASIIVNISSLACGLWFPVEIMSATFKKVIFSLPFIHFNNLLKAALSGNYSDMIKPLIVTLIYLVIIFIFATYIFKSKMKNDKI